MMKILYLLKADPDETLKKIMEDHRSMHDVRVMDIRENNDYAEIIESIENHDRVISW